MYRSILDIAIRSDLNNTDGLNTNHEKVNNYVTPQEYRVVDKPNRMGWDTLTVRRNIHQSQRSLHRLEEDKFEAYSMAHIDDIKHYRSPQHHRLGQVFVGEPEQRPIILHSWRQPLRVIWHSLWQMVSLLIVCIDFICVYNTHETKSAIGLQ